MSRIVFGIIIKMSEITILNNSDMEHQRDEKKLVVIVSSTGGPKALQKIIPRIPHTIAAPILLVQHMADSMTDSFATRLNSLGEITVKEALQGDAIEEGIVYVAKGGFHLTVDWSDSKSTVFLDDSPAVMGLKPSADMLLESLINSRYDEIVCVILTGMGQDGTAGIEKLKETNKLYVIAQDEASSTVYGMPKAVAQKKLTNAICDLDEIAYEIIRKVGVR